MIVSWTKIPLITAQQINTTHITSNNGNLLLNTGTIKIPLKYEHHMIKINQTKIF